MPDKLLSLRLPIFVMAMLALLAGMWAGLSRMGLQIPQLLSTAPVENGPIMVCGFFGTLVSLERAVAIGKRWAYLGLILCGAGGLILRNVGELGG